MNRGFLGLASGVGTNLVGYVIGVAILSLVSQATSNPLLWAFVVFLWFASLIVGGWVVSLMAGRRQVLLGYLSAALGLAVVTLTLRFVLHIEVPLLPVAVGWVAFSTLGAIGALTYSRKGG